MQLFSIITFFASIAVAASILTKRDGPSPGQVQLDNYSCTGTGCGTRGTTYMLSDDLTTIAGFYYEFTVQTGPGIMPSEALKDSHVTIILQISQGWQFSIAKVEYSGYANVSEGVTAKADSFYDLSGSSQTIPSSINFQGPFDASFEKTDVFSVENTVWSPCGMERIILHINSRHQISLLDTKQPAQLGSDAVTIPFSQVNFLQWRNCTPIEPSSQQPEQGATGC